MARIAHVTDLHLGPPAIPAVAEALVEAVRALEPDAVVVTGDLVQFCEHHRAWREARALLDRLPEPLVVVPGNHDLALLNPLLRAVDPFRQWRRYLGRPLEPEPLALPGALVIPISTPRAWAVDLGHVSEQALAKVRAACAAAPAGTLHMVALHHGLRDLPFTWFRTNVYGYRRAITSFVDSGVELALSGHNHFPHVEVLGPSERARARALVWAQGGTACSWRFRNPAYRKCSFSVIEWEPGGASFDVAWHACGPDEQRFVEEQRFSFPRPVRAPTVAAHPRAGQPGPQSL